MLSKILLLQLCLLLLLSCQNNTKIKKKESNLNDSLAHIEPRKPQTSELERDNFLLDSFSNTFKRRRIEIKTMSKYLDTSSQYFEMSEKKCSDWSLKADEIREILMTSERVDSRELHYYYDVFPCYYFGKLLFNNKHALYKVNAGAFCIIEFKDTSLIYGYKKNDYKKYFLLGPGID